MSGMLALTLAGPSFCTMHWAGPQAKGLRFLRGRGGLSLQVGGRQPRNPSQTPPPQDPKHELTLLECHLLDWRKFCAEHRQQPQMESLLLPHPHPGLPSLCPAAAFPCFLPSWRPCSSLGIPSLT